MANCGVLSLKFQMDIKRHVNRKRVGMPNVNDLRYVRTEKAIRSAFLELVVKRPVASVTASDVCRNAGISRNAFYLHHSSVSALYSTLVDELVSDVREESLASAERRVATGRDDALSKNIVRTLARHEKLLRTLLPSDDGSLTKQLAEGIEQAYIEAALRISERGDSIEHRLTCSFVGWASVGFVVKWVTETDRPISESESLFEQLHADLAEKSAHYLMGAGTAS